MNKIKSSSAGGLLMEALQSLTAHPEGLQTLGAGLLPPGCCSPEAPLTTVFSGDAGGSAGGGLAALAFLERLVEDLDSRG